MKYGIKYIGGLLLGATMLITTSCNKKLDVLPGTQVPTDQIKNENDIQAILFGGYKSLQNYDGFGERFLFVTDLYTNNNVIYTGTFQNYADVYSQTVAENSTIASGMWGNAYEGINGMNLVLSRLDLVSDANKKAIEGEAKFIRSVFLFELAGIYGLPYSNGNVTTNLAVPIMTKPVLSGDDLGESKKPRATVDELYKQVIADLKFAADNLPESYDTKKDMARANKYAAHAFLSRVYLSMGDYKNAAEEANTVIESGAYALVPDWANEFNNTTFSTEDIFAILQTSQSNAGTSNNGLVTFYSFDQRGEVLVDPAFVELYGDGDKRKSFYTVLDPETMTSNKWRDFYGTIPVIRLAEMYLTRAEANLRGGTTIGDTPLNDVNTVRTRSKAAPLTTVTADDVVNERRLELCFEGDDYWTNKRLKLNLGQLAYNADKAVFPIPLRELQVNPLLKQNKGYREK
ncbi:SusD family protein [Chitinophaga terrae (ex Kim and Jung 2007)]|uniref:SusD family protein n=1 Tax=Chitinophaga terrae (ex Kim and Jung 2007) TaxID=408074 RepID=A0A1H4GK30_9BACT|nr:RagB/SusD family nutrient uptake outer membrane protein [Chitinophaga terrae (ex Kim and Jung 2007)]GEP93466.1 membrane protein [Chitinophaga terrae (ex Kim and Jung 2007)]SEB09340.1 SusD family protein [Chitinophaga terrae (ex Kim and Jung 2007)]